MIVKLRQNVSGDQQNFGRREEHLSDSSRKVGDEERSILFRYKCYNSQHVFELPVSFCFPLAQ